MRGDSLRDLYAKVLALCGLGLLAGAGALVDYWPVQDELPRVAAGRPDLAPPSPRALDADASMSSLPASAAVTRHARRPPVSAQPATRGAVATRPRPESFPSSQLPVQPTLDVTAISQGAVDDFDAPPIAPTLAPPVEPLVEVAAAPVPLPRHDMIGTEPAPIEALRESANHESDGDGFFSGAFKKTGAVASASLAKTGDAIVKGGAVAGASIVDVFRGLAGAVKKVSPFVP